MKSAAVSTLKATLSACLAKVKAGGEVIVMERGKPIASWCRCLAMAKLGLRIFGISRAQDWLVWERGSCRPAFGRCAVLEIDEDRWLKRCCLNAPRGDEILGCVSRVTALSS